MTDLRVKVERLLDLSGHAPIGGAEHQQSREDAREIIAAIQGASMSEEMELRVERVARAIDPQTWTMRDNDLTRREEWERDIKIGWGDKTFEEWANRFVGKSLEQARAAIEALSRYPDNEGDEG